MGKFSVIRSPVVSTITTFTSNSTLKLSVASVGHVNSRGKIMYLCMALGVSRWKGRGEVGVGTLAHRCLLEISISTALALQLQTGVHIFNDPPRYGRKIPSQMALSTRMRPDAGALWRATYSGMDMFRHTSPSAIWMFWISVASLAYPSKHPHVSTRTSCSSIDLIGASDIFKVISPVNGFVIEQTDVCSNPSTAKSGTAARSFKFSSDAGLHQKRRWKKEKGGNRHTDTNRQYAIQVPRKYTHG